MNQTTIADERAADAADAAIAPAEKPAWLKNVEDERRYLLAEILKPNAPVVLLEPSTLTMMLGFTPNALAIMRMNGKGPRFLKMGNNFIRYKSDDVAAWLKSTERTSTSDTGAN